MQTLLNTLFKDREDYEIHMAKIEIKKRTANILSILQWKYILRTQIEIPWPVWPITLDDWNGYRPFLEEHVGKQGWKWDWRVGPSVNLTRSTLIIKFRYSKDATNFLLVHI